MRGQCVDTSGSGRRDKMVIIRGNGVSVSK